MAVMYVANCTQQNQEFCYRLNGNLRVQHIPIGGQIALSGDLSNSDVDAVLAQHNRYGLIPVEEVDRSKPFIGLCYALDRRMNVDQIRRAIIHNAEVLEDRGKQMRQESAVALNAAIEERNGPLRSLEMSFAEHRENPNNLEGAIAEGYRVTRDAPEETGRRRRRGSRK
jgi:hypothetical protein